MEWALQVQILDEAVDVSFFSNAIETGLNSTVLPQAMGKELCRHNSLVLIGQSV